MTSEADNIIGFYERHARDWVNDRLRTRLIEKDWLGRFAALIAPRGSVLDLGCGPGKPMAAYLLAQGFGVCGIDSSSTMAALARGNFPQSEWILADMRTLDLRRTFAAVMAWDSFFHLSYDDQGRMFPIFRAHADRKSVV